MTPEDRLQIAAANYLRLQYPNVLWLHCPNGGSRNAIEGAKLKAMGVLKGVSDVLILEKRKDATGLAIELKYGKNKPTTEQLEFLDKLKARGWKTEVIYSIDAFIEAVNQYMAA